MADPIRPPGYNSVTVDNDDLFNDVVDNIVVLLENAKLLGTIKVSEIYKYDNSHVTSFPSVVVVWQGPSTEQVRTMGRVYTHQTDVSVVIYYYHAEAMDEMARRELATAAHKLADVIRTHRNCNGFSNIGMSISSITPVNRVFEDRVVKAVKIEVTVPIDRRVSQATL